MALEQVLQKYKQEKDQRIPRAGEFLINEFK